MIRHADQAYRPSAVGGCPCSSLASAIRLCSIMKSSKDD